MKTKDVLVKARSLVEKGWTQGVAARNDYGYHVEPTDSDACYWCATGAIQAVLPKDVLFSDYCDLLASEAPYDIVLFNDDADTTKEDILKVYDKAIARCMDE